MLLTLAISTALTYNCKIELTYIPRKGSEDEMYILQSSFTCMEYPIQNTTFFSLDDTHWDGIAFFFAKDSSFYLQTFFL